MPLTKLVILLRVIGENALNTPETQLPYPYQNLICYPDKSLQTQNSPAQTLQKPILPASSKRIKYPDKAF